MEIESLLVVSSTGSECLILHDGLGAPFRRDVLISKYFDFCLSSRTHMLALPSAWDLEPVILYCLASRAHLLGLLNSQFEIQKTLLDLLSLVFMVFPVLNA